MEFKLAKGGVARTNAYKGTVTDLNDVQLIALKKNVDFLNKEECERYKHCKKRYGIDWYIKHNVKRTRYELRVRPRGTRKYTNANGVQRENYYDTPKENAKYFDVYVRERTLTLWRGKWI